MMSLLRLMESSSKRRRDEQDENDSDDNHRKKKKSVGEDALASPAWGPENAIITAVSSPLRSEPSSHQDGERSRQKEIVEDEVISRPDLWRVIDRELRVNIGASVRCSICLHTMTNPVITPCVHAFCGNCMDNLLRGPSPKCPSCNQTITRRSCHPFPFITQLGTIYKEMLRDFGLNPTKTDPTFTTLTQAAPESCSEEDDDPNQMLPEEGASEKLKIRERAQVSLTWKSVLQQDLNVEEIFVSENAKVVEANAKELKKVGGMPTRRISKLSKGCPGSRAEEPTATTATTIENLTRPPPNPTKHHSTIVNSRDDKPPTTRCLILSAPSPGEGTLPNTQDIIEQNLEQQAADRSAEWDEEEIDQTVEQHEAKSDSSVAQNSRGQRPQETPTPTFGTAREEESQESPVRVEQANEDEEKPSTCSHVVGSTHQGATSKILSDGYSQVYATPAELPDSQAATSEDTQKPSPGPKANQGDTIKDGKPPAASAKAKKNEAFASSENEPIERDGEEYATGKTRRRSTRHSKPTKSARVEQSYAQPHFKSRPRKGRTVAAKGNSTREYCATGDPTVEAGTSPRLRSVTKDSAEVLPKSASDGPINVGTIVDVQPRTWPGVNKPGGVARVTRVNDDGSSYNVAYILGGRESSVDAVFVRPQDDRNRQRIRKTSSEAALSNTSYAAAAAAASWKEELPAELLDALANEGFDVGARPGASKKRKKEVREEATASADPCRSRSLDSGLGINAERNDSAPHNTRRHNSCISRKGRRRVLQDTSNEDSKSSKDGEAKKVFKARNANAQKAQRTSSLAKKATITEQYSAKNEQGSKAGDESLCERVDSQFCELADAHYLEHFNASLRERVVYVVASNLDASDLNLLKALTTKKPLLHAGVPVKMKLTEVFGKKTTLCITHADQKKGDDGNLLARTRTLKAMRSALAGIPIVSAEFVRECNEQSTIVTPTQSMLVRSLPTKTKSLESTGAASYGVASLAATMHESTEGSKGPLSHTFVLICGSPSPSKKKDIQVLLKEAGAKLLSNPATAVAKIKESQSILEGTEKKSKFKVVLLCDDSSCGSSINVIPAALDKQAKQSLREQPESLMVVNSSWLFDSITCGVVLDARAFEPRDPKAHELWSLLVDGTE